MTTPVRRRSVAKAAPATTASQTPAKASRAPQSARKPQPNKGTQPIDMTKIKVIPEYVDITDVQPYVFNARDNIKAIAAVKKSIQTFGFLVPIVIDADGNLAAGHTRIEAAKELGMTEVLAVRAEHLTTEQIDAFRLVDNKVSEIADWDTDLLAPELKRLTEFGFDFTSYGWSQEEIDCLSSVVSSDCLSLTDLTSPTLNSTEGGTGTQGRRGPQTTRFVMGEFVAFVPAERYRTWADGIRRLHNFNEEDMIAELLNRLGVPT